MNCREFRRKHDAYLDDTLSGVEIEAMTHHLRCCEECSARDTRVRRALLLAHNLPTIRPSSTFGERLQLRLTHERALMSASRATPLQQPRTFGRWRPLSAGAYGVLAAGLLVVAGMAAIFGAADPEPRDIRLAPVVASLPEAEPATLATPAMVASVPAGISVWPAVFVAQQAPWHFANDAAGR
jgi:hypothetical protein